MQANSRETVLDLAKGLAVLFMVQVHLMELFARPEVRQVADRVVADHEAGGMLDVARLVVSG